MRLLEGFLQIWEKSNIEVALTEIETELERRFGIFSDEDQYETYFFVKNPQGRVTATAVYEECMELYEFLHDLQVKKSPLMDIYEELIGWRDAIEVESIEEKVTEIDRSRLRHWISKINKIPCKKKMYVLQKKDNNWCLAEGCSFDGYRNGSFTFLDMKIRRILYQHIMDPIRILVVAGGMEGDACIEI